MREPKERNKLVPMTDIILDEDRIQVRVRMSEPTAVHYAEAMRQISEDSSLKRFPPVDLFVGRGIPDGMCLLADGYHRFRAHQLNGAEHIEANVFEGSPDDAFLHGGSSNSTNPLQLTIEDRQKFLRGLLLSPTACKWSPGRMATFIGGISRNTVNRWIAKMRQEDRELDSHLSNGQVGDEIVYVRDGVEQVMRKGALGGTKSIGLTAVPPPDAETIDTDKLLAALEFVKGKSTKAKKTWLFWDPETMGECPGPESSDTASSQSEGWVPPPPVERPPTPELDRLANRFGREAPLFGVLFLTVDERQATLLNARLGDATPGEFARKSGD